MVKVSIIIPVYNGIKFINKCMDRIINQTYSNIEVILIDDGSKDNSYELLKKYDKKYENVKSYSHPNKGQSQTRNIGLKYASGDYVTYLDVDDYFDHDFIETFVKESNNCDIVIGGYRRVFDNGEVEFTYNHKDNEWNKYKRATVWAKLYKKSFLDKNNIAYPNVNLYGEDVVYTMRCLSKSPKVRIIDYVGYNNLINDQSITHRDKDKILNDVPKMIENIDSFIKDNKNFLENNSKIVKYYYLKLFSNFLIEQAEFLKYDKLKKYYIDNISVIKKIFKSYGYKLGFIWVKDEKFIVNIFINLVVLTEKMHLRTLLLFFVHKVFFK